MTNTIYIHQPEKSVSFTRLPNFLFEAPTFTPLSNEAIPTRLFKQAVNLSKQARAIEATLGDITPFNAGKKKEEALSMNSAIFPYFSAGRSSVVALLAWSQNSRTTVMPLFSQKSCMRMVHPPENLTNLRFLPRILFTIRTISAFFLL